MKDIKHPTSKTVKELEPNFFQDTSSWYVIKRRLQFHIAMEVFILDSSANNACW